VNRERAQANGWTIVREFVVAESATDLTSHRRRQATALTKRKSELATMQDRLLNAYLASTVEEILYKTKSNELKSEAKKAEESINALGDVDPTRGKIALAIFDFTQNAADRWRGSNNAIRREILDLVCLNRTLGDVNLDATKRKPFDVFAERLDLKNSRGDRIRTCDLLVPNLQKTLRIYSFSLGIT
jgi:hypothetical protein